MTNILYKFLYSGKVNDVQLHTLVASRSHRELFYFVRKLSHSML